MSQTEARCGMLPLLSLFVGLFLGAGTGYMLEGRHEHANPDCAKNYSLLRQDLDCKSAYEDVERVRGLSLSTEALVKREIAAGNATRISVFYRDLNSRRWFGVNDNENFAPGSLMKLPLAIAYYRLSEMRPDIMGRQFEFRPTSPDNNTYAINKPKASPEIGKIYSVKELIAFALVESDNESALLLNQTIEPEFFARILEDLGITVSTTENIDVVSTRVYASIFRMLFLASYLNIDNSQEVLSLLSRSTYRDGLAASIPSDIAIAHKFGERGILDPQSGRVLKYELHDCGIVYTKEPYILCVMTEGDDPKVLPEIVASLSAHVFKERE